MQVKFADFFLEARKAIDSFDIPPVVDLTDVKVGKACIWHDLAAIL